MLFDDKITAEIHTAIGNSKSERKRLKVKTLINKFGLKRRTEKNTTEITEALKNSGIKLNPSIMKLGDKWELSLEDWVVLSLLDQNQSASQNDFDVDMDNLPCDWQDDPWFDFIQNQPLRTEKEVETKFIIPLLAKLGYTDSDRYDDMTIHVFHGSKPTILRIDFALFNQSYETLNNQVILIVEAKKESRLTKSVEIENAYKQSKSYAVWTGCEHCLITDGNEVYVYNLSSNYREEDNRLFHCSRPDLKNSFPRLYSLISKEILSQHYLSKFQLVDEIPSDS